MWMISYVNQSVHGDNHETIISKISPLEFILVMNNKSVGYNLDDDEHYITDINSTHITNVYKLSDDDLEILNEYIERSTKDA